MPSKTLTFYSGGNPIADDIGYLDFELPEGVSSLRERAAGMVEREIGAYKTTLLQYAQERAVAILEEPIVSAEIHVTNRDGDGTVHFTLDGIRFRVCISFPSGARGDMEPTKNQLEVRLAGGVDNWHVLHDLYGLGLLLRDNKITIIEDRKAA